MKIRKKPCRHCLYTKNHLGDPKNIDEIRSAADRSQDTFKCHEHSGNQIVCCMYAKKHEVAGVKISENGDLKHKFSNLTREEMNRYTIGGIK